MTVRELRDKLNELIAKDESYGDAPVYYDDDELNLMPIDAEEVNVVKAIQKPSFRYEPLDVGDVFCCLNVNRYDRGEFEYRVAGGAMVMPAEFLNGNNEKAGEALAYIASKIAEEVFIFNFAVEMDNRFQGVQYTDEVKYILENYRKRFEEKVEEEFYQKWHDDLLKSFTPWDVKRILKMAKTTSFKISLSGDKEDTIPF